ncbi:hypothetical protein BH11ARM2_BH11ARM2_29660 [soil metagenome]
MKLAERETMKTRLKDVAEHLNLSSALVSGILNRRENVWASEETRARIFQAARELNYGDYPTPALKKEPEASLNLLLLGEASGAASLIVALARETTLCLSACSDVATALQWATSNAHTRTVVMGDPALVASVVPILAMSFVVVGSGAALDFDYPALASGAVDHLRALGHQRIALLGEGPAAFKTGFLNACRSVRPRFVPATEDGVKAALHGEEPPTGWVVADAKAWGLLESCLALSGERLGFEPGSLAASGLYEGPPLSLGQALVYDLAAGATLLAQAAVAGLRSGGAPVPVSLRLSRIPKGGAR